jgi:hypothetical protein
MKKSISLLLLITLATLTSAQQNKFNAGLEFGPGVNMLFGNEMLRQNAEASPGMSAGLTFQYNFPKILSLRTGVVYDKKGCDFVVIFTDYNGNRTGQAAMHSNFYYVDVPLLVRASFGKKVSFFINAGAYCGYLVKHNYTYTSMQVAIPSYDNTYNYKRFDFGIAAGLGLAIPLGSKILLSFEVRNTTGLLNTSKLHLYNDGSIKTNSITFLTGLAYRFGKREAEPDDYRK